MTSDGWLDSWTSATWYSHQDIPELRRVSLLLFHRSQAVATMSLPTTTHRMSCCSLRNSISAGANIRETISTARCSIALRLQYKAFHSVAGEDAFFDEQIQAIERRWRAPRFTGIKRPYTAMDVATKQGTLPQSYPSSSMAGRLFQLLQDRTERGEPVHTSTAHEPAFRSYADPPQWVLSTLCK